MTPWLARVNEVRMQVYLNATDRTRKDQRAWIKDYEQMIVTAVGDRGRFITPKEEKRVPTHTARRRDEPGEEDGAADHVTVVE